MKKLIFLILSLLLIIATFPFACAGKNNGGSTGDSGAGGGGSGSGGGGGDPPDVEEFADKRQLFKGFYMSKTNPRLYYIYTAEGLKNFGLYYENNSLCDATVYIKDDIDFNDEWESLDFSGSSFQNIKIDGLGHCISGLKLLPCKTQIDDNKPIGFIGKANANITVNNLTFKNITLSETVKFAKWAGVVVGYHNDYNLNIFGVTIDGCNITPTAEKSKKIGGILGFSSITNSSGNYGLHIENCTIKNSTFSGDKSVSAISGTVVGYYSAFQQETTVVSLKNCTVTGNTLTAKEAPVGVYFIDETKTEITEMQNASLFESFGCSASNNTVLIKK